MTRKSPAKTPRPLTAGEAIDRILAIRDRYESARIDALMRVVDEFRAKEQRVFERVPEHERRRVHAAVLSFQNPLEEPDEAVEMVTAGADDGTD